MNKMKKILRHMLTTFVIKNNRKEVAIKRATQNRYSTAWKSENIPLRQWEIVEQQLEKFDSGVISPEFQVFIESLKDAISVNPSRPLQSLLELGCSSGYYGKVLEKVFPNMSYTGLDYSLPFIEFGKERFPQLELGVADTTNLPFSDRVFDCVVSGSVLLHVYDWQIGIKETCRVASTFVLIHRTPVSKAQTTLFTKIAYGQKMIEWTFNDDELIDEVQKHGFKLMNLRPVYGDEEVRSSASSPVQFTYLFERI